MKFTVMDRIFETDEAKMLIDQAGNSTPYRLAECFMRHNPQEGVMVFANRQEGDHVVFYGEAVVDTGHEKTHPTFILIRDGRVVEVRHPYEGIIFD